MTAPWLEDAVSHIGTKEIRGKDDNPKIMKWYDLASDDSVPHDETPWCAAFVGAMLETNGMKGSRSLLARSYLKVGKPCPPKPGAIVVFPRGKSWQGHVAFVEKVHGDHVHTIDGNVSNKVARRRYAIKSALGFRWPHKKVLPEAETVKAVTKETGVGVAGPAAGTAIGVGTGIAKSIETDVPGTVVTPPAAAVPLPPQEVVDGLSSWQAFSAQVQSATTMVMGSWEYVAAAVLIYAVIVYGLPAWYARAQA